MNDGMTQYMSMVYGYKYYDFVNPRATRTPDDYPYSFDAYYLWKTKELDKAYPVYTDRMRQQDPEKASKAFKGLGQFGNYTEKQCKQIVKDFFGNNAKCVGYALSCNVSSGYPIGIFM